MTTPPRKIKTAHRASCRMEKRKCLEEVIEQNISAKELLKQNGNGVLRKFY